MKISPDYFAMLQIIQLLFLLAKIYSPLLSYFQFWVKLNFYLIIYTIQQTLYLNWELFILKVKIY